MQPVRLGVKPVQSIMVPHQLKEDGTCSTCDVAVTDKQFFECASCKEKYHAQCNGTLPYCGKTAVQQFKALAQAKPFFKFVCPHCQTAEENVAASTMKEQMAELVAVVDKLVKEVNELKKEKRNDQHPEIDANQQTAETVPPAAIPPKPQHVWEDQNRIKKVKEGVTVCIKSDGQAVDMTKVKQIVTTNGIQVNKASISKKNGDVYIDLPSDESRAQLLPLLNDADIPGNRIVNVKQKCPTISIRNVADYIDENDFVEKVKAQNQAVKEKIEAGAEFSVVFTRRSENSKNEPEERHLIVVRVGDEVRDALKTAGDRIFLGFSSYRVMDRVYVKSCAKCHKFGHYHAECTNDGCCGYCMSEQHTSEHCPVREEKDQAKFKCVNCKDANKTHEGHSSHYNRCPTYLQIQKKNYAQCTVLRCKKQAMRLSSVQCNMLLWNVWSIANEEKLNNFLQILDDKNISIACVTETWFDSKKGAFSKTINDAGFKLNHAFRRDKRGGGCAIMYKSKLSVKSGDASSSEFQSFEYCSVTLTLKAGTKLVIICLYRKQEILFRIFQDELTSLMDKFVVSGNMVCVVGDFNVWIDVDGDKVGEALSDLMSSYGLLQQVEQPTHREGHTLDHIYTNPYHFSIHHEVIYESLGFTSDHYPLIIQIPTSPTHTTTQTVSHRKLRDMDVENFRLELSDAITNLDSKHMLFAEHVCEIDRLSLELMDKYAPMVTWKKKGSHPPWMDNEYKQNRALRRKYERAWKKRRTDENMLLYTQQKKRCTEIALEKQTNYYTKLVEDAGHCQKTLFKVANELLDKNEERVLPFHTDSKSLANRFNNFFVNKVQKIRQSIPAVSGDSSYYAQPFEGQPLEVLRPTNVEEIEKIIKQCGIKTSVEDPMPAKLIKMCLDILLPVYSDLVNKSLLEGSIEKVKTSVIDPLIKKAGLDPDVDKNYRPVNNLRFLSKLTERVAKIRKDEHMTSHALHTPEEFGYKQNHNTETMMLGLTDEVLRGFDENQATIVIFLDLSAAFDTIDPDKLLQIMEEELGITGIALQWFRSFLVGRTQRVKIDKEYSDSVEVPCGTPQGSVLGPPLFNTNVRSQPKVFQHCRFNTSSFADDSNGRRTFSLTFQFDIIKHEVVKCLKLVVEWSNAHFMKINPDKTELLLFYPPSLEKEVLIKGVMFEDQCIRFSESVKNVGVYLDKHLKMDKHVDNVTSHGYKILKDIAKVKKNFSKVHLERLVQAVIPSR